MLLRIIEYSVIILLALFVITQIILPAVFGWKFFWIFRKDSGVLQLNEAEREAKEQALLKEAERTRPKPPPAKKVRETPAEKPPGQEEAS